LAALFGLLAAAGYGTADFLGGWASRREGVLPVVLGSQAAGLVALLVVLVPSTAGTPTAAALGWGSAAGTMVALGLVVYLRALAGARMGVVAPTTSVVTVALPVCVGLLLGEQPSTLQLAGIAVAVAAVALVSLAPAPAGDPVAVAPAGPCPPAVAPAVPPAVPCSPDQAGGRRGARPPGVVGALASGVLFGLFFVFMDRAGPGSALWPLLAANVASFAVVAGVVAARRRPWRPGAGSLPAIVGAGVIGTAASLAFLLAVRRGMLSLASVLASLSPATTVVLARIVVRERLAPLQLAGLGAAVAGVALIGAG